MDTNSLIKLVGAVGQEKLIIKGIVLEMGIDVLMSHTDSICISNKTKIAINQLECILNGKEDVLANVTALTEIPKRTLSQFQSSEHSIHELLKHPEKIDVDTRQFEKVRCLIRIMEDYQYEKYKVKNQEGIAQEMEEEEFEP